ncbi:MAG TPA: sigma-70 family RNA polymerase sigma factor [Spirochaetota bacterium]|jgi:RNA polymerase sigma-70 factor (ECF subfamily)|nr:sigma-70 family RNA polymerase sigma factor [Spirochaetota bacterium]OPZ37873.1 MAG: ECF RNA polymerase sigma-E factor [Spirochaetes bacterium ADurb.BinA120]HNU91179.1 sigma-70 family RNA polymerase sigma factor [Spirochaetota bacterium]HPI14601.1 sigma-70 family RNA polymerase sigma factor [Spirochaetota bacterium]HPO44887.1 sigma-70 family RNA polymerase sigma factor [Spirochaetota bacterium]
MSEKGAEALADERIVTLVLRGRTDLFRELVKRHQRRVHYMGMRFFRNDDDARDFAQEVFMKAYTALGSFRGESRFVTWLLRIGFNHAANRRRASHDTAGVEEDYPESRYPGPEALSLRAETAEAVSRALASLPGKYRICVDFFFFMGLSYGEISDITGFPVNTIKSHVFRAKGMLRDALRGSAAEEYHEM